MRRREGSARPKVTQQGMWWGGALSSWGCGRPVLPSLPSVRSLQSPSGRGVLQVEAGQRCPLCRGRCVPPRSESPGWECPLPRECGSPLSSRCSRGSSPPTQGPCRVLCDLPGGHAWAPETCGASPSSRALELGAAGGAPGAAPPSSVPRGFESLVSFLFRGVILRTWCHQRVDGQADTSSLSNWGCWRSRRPRRRAEAGRGGDPVFLPETQLFLLSRGKTPRSAQGVRAVPRACPPSPFAPLLPSTAPPFLEEEMQAWRGRATGPGRSQEGARPRCTPAPQPPFPRVCGRGSPSRCGAPLLHLVASWPPNWDLPPETEGGLTWPCTAPSAGGKEGLRGGSLGPFLWDRAGRGLWPCCLWVVPISWYYQGASGCQEVSPAPSPESCSRAEPSAPSASHPGARRRLQDSPSLSVACVCPA